MTVPPRSGTDPVAPARSRWPPALRGVTDRLFVPARPDSGRRGVAVAVAAILAGTTASLLRHPGRVALDTVYAEDGTVFLADAVAVPLASLVSPYAGYFHLGPRLLALLIAQFPGSAAAALLALSAAAVTASLAVVVYVAAAGHFSSTTARVLVAAPVVVAPLAQQEVPNSVANLHWPALYAVFWLLLWTPRRRAGRVVALCGMGLTALSDILIMVFLPLAAMRLVVRRDRFSVALGGVLAFGLAVQVSGLLTGAGSRDLALDPVQPVAGYALRAVPAALLGERWLPEAGADPLRLAAAALAWLLIAAVVVIAHRRCRPQWTLAVAAGTHSIALYALPVVLSGVAPQRYALAPALLVVASLAALLHPGTPVRRPGRGVVAAPLAVLVAGYAVVCLANFRVETVRDQGPQWSIELDRARLECVVAGVDSVAVPVTPAGSGWTVDLPCHYLSR